jgi:hypothetical protein
VLPDGDEGGGAVLAVVEEDDHAVRVHRLAGVELVVLEVGNDLLGKALGLALEVLDLGLVGALGAEGRLDCLHVACRLSVCIRCPSFFSIPTLEVCEVALLVEARRVQTEGIDDIIDLLRPVLDALLGLLCGRVATGVYVLLAAKSQAWRGGMRTERLSTDGHHAAVDFVCDAVDLDHVVRVGDDLIVGDNILRGVSMF